jgi:hypothetical protein
MKRENPFDQIPEDRTAVDNILRINVNNQVRLTVMADQKANIMITVASIVFSVTVANLNNEVMKWPLLFFALGCTVSLLAAIFAIIPQTGYPKIPGTNEIDRDSPAFNPLFFGHFAHIPIEEYKEDYAETLMTDDRIYDALAGDIYGIGTTLMNNKYKWLRRSYMAFLVGMSGAITIFCIQTIGSADWIWDMMGAVGQELKFLGEGLCFYSLRCQ